MNNEDYAVKCFSGEIRWQSELERIFTQVAPLENWKERIEAEIKWPLDLDTTLISDAVVHFTGSVPVIKRLDEPWIRVTAAGYYATIGA